MGANYSIDKEDDYGNFKTSKAIKKLKRKKCKFDSFKHHETRPSNPAKQTVTDFPKNSSRRNVPSVKPQPKLRGCHNERDERLEFLRRGCTSDSFEYHTHSLNSEDQPAVASPVNSSKRNVPKVCQDERNAGVPFRTDCLTVHKNIPPENTNERRKAADKLRNSVGDMPLFQDLRPADAKYFSVDKLIRQDTVPDLKQTLVEDTKNSVVDGSLFHDFILNDKFFEEKKTLADTVKISFVDGYTSDKTTLQDNIFNVKEALVEETKYTFDDVTTFEKDIQKDNKSAVRQRSVEATINPLYNVVHSDKSILQDESNEREKLIEEGKYIDGDVCPLGRVVQKDNKSEMRMTEGAKNPIVDVCSIEDILYKFYTDKMLTDITLRTNSEIFPVHKLVLCCRSVVFRDIFAEYMNIKTMKYVDIAEDAGTLRRLLLYIYKNEVEVMQWEEAADLFKAAEKYELLDLQQKCSVIVKSKISKDNFCGILSFADRYNETEVLDTVLDFMSQIPDIFNSESWKLFKKENPEFALNTMERLINNFKTFN